MSAIQIRKMRYALTFNKIAQPQLSLLVSIARIDYPRHFPDLPQHLLNPLVNSLSHITTTGPSSSHANVVMLNSLWTINALIKEWRTIKVASGQEAMKGLELVFVPTVRQVLDLWADRERSGGADYYLGEAGRYAFK